MIIFEGRRFSAIWVGFCEKLLQLKYTIPHTQLQMLANFLDWEPQTGRTNAIITAKDDTPLKEVTLNKLAFTRKTVSKLNVAKTYMYIYMYICTYAHRSGNTIQFFACMYIAGDDGNCLSSLPV